MAAPQARGPPTWTAYPSLLHSLRQEEQRTAFEDASRASYCGRYLEAERIFQSQLPPSHTLPVLALEHADMLNSQGLEGHRMELLQLALANLPPEDQETVRSEHLLLKFMLADAELLHTGNMRSLQGLLKPVRDHIRASGLQELSDIMLRLITLYYRVVDFFQEHSNYLGKEDHVIFPRSPDKVSEIKSMRQTLQRENQWRFAPTFMQLELKYTAPGLTLKAAVDDAFELCKSLSETADERIQFRSVVLKKQLAGVLSGILPSLATVTTQEYIKILRKITPAANSRWQDFFPVIAFDLRSTEILDSGLSELDILNDLAQHGGEAETAVDYTKANHLYLCSQCRKTEIYIKFHQRTGLAYFEAAAFVDFMTTLSTKDHHYSKVLEMVDKFEARHKEFCVPRLLERLYGIALIAAEHLGLHEKVKKLKLKHRTWVSKCPFSRCGVRLSDEAILNPDFAVWGISSTGSDPIERGAGALKLMLRWTGYQWNQDLISADECRSIFGPGLGEIPQANLSEYLDNLDCSHLSESIFGTTEQPAHTSSFQGRYRRLLAWTTNSVEKPPRPTRLHALKILLQSRLDRYRQYLAERGAVPTVDEALTLEDESLLLKELEKLEVVESGGSVDGQESDVTSAIHITLVKSFASDAKSSGLIDDAEMALRATQCQELIQQHRNSGHLHREYHALCELLRLTWQRYYLFRSVNADELLPTADGAEAVFIKTRNAITTLDASDDLIARIKLSQDFNHREHYNFALAASQTALENRFSQANRDPSAEANNLAFQSYFTFVNWLLKSKGRGFTDILNLETAVPQAIDRVENATREDSPTGHEHQRPSPESITLDSGFKTLTLDPPGAPTVPFNGPTITKQRLDEMLQSLPDGVAIVDFIDIVYAYPPCFVAMIHRKGGFSFPLKIPNMSMRAIDRWVRDHLDVPEQEHKQLSGEGAMDKLARLAGLLEPLTSTAVKNAIKPGETVIFCPTGSLNRVPIHAIPVGNEGRPLIERNPVVYCQSLTILHWLWRKFQTNQGGREHRSPPGKHTVINPLPNVYEDGSGAPFQSTERVANLAHSLQAEFLHGAHLSVDAVRDAISGSSVFHYHGHILYKAQSALDAALALSDPITTRPRDLQKLTARNMFALKLSGPALATVIGCGSGITSISNSDDVLDIPTALFYVGASSVVSTLWPLEDEDGAEFAREFYGAVIKSATTAAAAAAASAGAGAPGGSSASVFANTVNLARAMRSAIVNMRNNPERAEYAAPYHWAAFTLNGFWIFPAQGFQTQM